MSSPIEAALRTHGKTLTASEAKVAALLDRSEEVICLNSISEVARQAGVSDPTVTRCIRRLGFSSYKELQNLVRERVQARLDRTSVERIKRAAFEEDLVHKAQRTETRNLTRTLEQLDIYRLSEVVDALGAARRIFTLCRRSAVSAAVHLAHCLSEMRDGVVCLPLTLSQEVDLLVDAGPQDVMLVVSLARYSRHSVRLAEVAAAQQVRVVLVTDSRLAPAAKYAWQTILVEAETESPFPSYTAVSAVTNLMAAMYANRFRAAVEDRMVRLDPLLREVELSERYAGRSARQI